MVGRGRLLVVTANITVGDSRSATWVHRSHFSNDTLRFQEDHLFSRTGLASFLLRFFPFFSFSFSPFFFLERDCLLCAICETWLRAWLLTYYFVKQYLIHTVGNKWDHKKAILKFEENRTSERVYFFKPKERTLVMEFTVPSYTSNIFI